MIETQMHAIDTIVRLPVSELMTLYEVGILLTAREAAQFVGVGEARIYQLIKQRRVSLPCLRLGFATLFHVDDLITHMVNRDQRMLSIANHNAVLLAYRESPADYAAWLKSNRKRQRAE